MADRRQVYDRRGKSPSWRMCRMTKQSSRPADTKLGPSMSARTPFGRAQSLQIAAVGLLLAIAVCDIALAVFTKLTDPRYEPRRKVRLEEPSPSPDDEPGSAASSKPSLRIAIAPVLCSERSAKTCRGLVEYLARKLDRRPAMLSGKTYAEINDLVRQGRCEMALVCAYPFVRGEREFGMEALAAPEINGALTHHSLVLVPMDSRATTLLDLRGKRFASADAMSGPGWLFPAAWLKGHGESPDAFFAERVITHDHDRSIAAVATGSVEGAAVPSIEYDRTIGLDPSLRERTRVILKSLPIGVPPLVCHPNMEPELKLRLRTALLEMSGDPGGKQVLQTLGIGRFVVPPATVYESVREAAKALESRP